MQCNAYIALVTVFQEKFEAELEALNRSPLDARVHG